MSSGVAWRLIFTPHAFATACRERSDSISPFAIESSHTRFDRRCLFARPPIPPCRCGGTSRSVSVPVM